MRNENLLEPTSGSFLTALPSHTVGDFLSKIKNQHSSDNILAIIIDDSNQFLGFVPTIDLIRSRADVKLKTLLKKAESVPVLKSKEYLANFAIKHKMIFVPLVDDQNKFVGVFDTYAIIETLRNEHVEDLHRLSGIKKDRVSASIAISEPPIISVWHRLPWLLVGLAGSFFATYVMSNFESTLRKNISLAFFIPGIIYLADAIGTQTETIVIRGLSLTWKSFKKSFFRELYSGFLLGIFLGSLSFFAAYIFGFEVKISFTVFLSIVFAGAIATSIGLLLPSTLKKLGIDPAFGSGPLATVIQDVLSIVIYLLIASLVLGDF